ncbi:antibiotic biosynthesis monooxygenase family protein [Flagellimonas marina]|uniref:Antibiotic biosynthesis monooxygenase family protein n=1 Tax=Flagellimonas marina TaxID=1775168 RepID=A0ABV8PLE5_9FLAO
MHVVIYEFEVKTGVDNKFKEAWEKLTKAYLDHAGSYGSRLHKCHNRNYIAYAQWPSKESHAIARRKLTNKSRSLLDELRSTCSNVKILCQLEVLKDYLVHS